MADYITLLGAEQVQNAGRTMSDAADRMRSAASSIDDSLMRHRQFLDDWLQRFAQALLDHAEMVAHPIVTVDAPKPARGDVYLDKI